MSVKRYMVPQGDLDSPSTVGPFVVMVTERDHVLEVERWKKLANDDLGLSMEVEKDLRRQLDALAAQVAGLEGKVDCLEQLNTLQNFDKA